MGKDAQDTTHDLLYTVAFEICPEKKASGATGCLVIKVDDEGETSNPQDGRVMPVLKFSTKSFVVYSETSWSDFCRHCKMKRLWTLQFVDKQVTSDIRSHNAIKADHLL